MRMDCLRSSSIAVAAACLSVLGCGADMSGYRPVPKTSEAVASAHNLSPAEPIALPEKTSDKSADVEPAVIIPVSAIAPSNVVDGSEVATLLKVAPQITDQPTEPQATASKPADATAAKEGPRKVELLVPERSFQTDSTSKALRVTYDDLDLLKVLNMEPVTENAVELMPEWLRNLNGKSIRIRGFMYPTFEAEGIERFVLARDNQICCFGRDPKVYDLVQVDMKPGTSTVYIPATRAFDVIGKFRIEMVSEDGKPFGLYFIEDAKVVDR